MAPLPRLSRRSFWFSRSPPRASMDRCSPQLNCSRTRESLTKIRRTVSLHTPGLLPVVLLLGWTLQSSENSNPRAGSFHCVIGALELGSEAVEPHVQPGGRRCWAHRPPGLARPGGPACPQAAVQSLPASQPLRASPPPALGSSAEASG